jgi:hypothetical protein
MKTIEEEWKTIEDFPGYEISNFGRCMRKRDGLILKKGKYKGGTNYYVLAESGKEGIKRTKRRFTSPGILVAKAFVANPNGYRQIIYFDGNPTNAFFTNIQWVKINNMGKRHPTRNEIPREEQLKKIREKIEMAERLEKALINGTEDEFVYGEIRDEIQKKINIKFKGPLLLEFKEEAVEAVTELISMRIKKGFATITFDYSINKDICRFYREYKQHQTTQFNEKIM